jgi:hypothetical protein
MKITNYEAPRYAVFFHITQYNFNLNGQPYFPNERGSQKWFLKLIFMQLKKVFKDRPRILGLYVETWGRYILKFLHIIKYKVFT